MSILKIPTKRQLAYYKEEENESEDVDWNRSEKDKEEIIEKVEKIC